jgi:hypothetical protein
MLPLDKYSETWRQLTGTDPGLVFFFKGGENFYHYEIHRILQSSEVMGCGSTDILTYLHILEIFVTYFSNIIIP